MFTVRDERDPAGARARQPRGRQRLALRQGPLRLPDDLLGGADHGAAARRQPRRLGAGARERRVEARRRARPDRGDRGRPGLQRGGLPRPADRPRGARLAARDLDRRARRRSARGALGPGHGGLDHGDRRRRVGARSSAPTRCNAMPILDLRLRKAVRHANLRLVVASDRPTALDGGAEETARYLPGEAAAFLAALAGRAHSATPHVLGVAEDVPGSSRRRRAPRRRAAPGQDARDLGRAAWAAAPAARRRCARCSRSARRFSARAEGGGAFSVPDGANARGVREVGCLPGARPRLLAGRSGPRPRGDQAGPARRRARRRRPAARPTRSATSPTAPAGPRRCARRARWSRSPTFEDASTKAADVVLPAEAYAEKEGTVTHPDGRLQRLRPSVPRPGQVRPVWQVLAELAAALGDETGSSSAPDALGCDRRRGPLLRRPHAGRDRRHRGALAGRGRRLRASRTATAPDGPPPGVPPPGENGGPAPRDLPRSLGRRGHRAQRRRFAS